LQNFLKRDMISSFETKRNRAQEINVFVPHPKTSFNYMKFFG
jgi:hypothetical protein